MKIAVLSRALALSVALMAADRGAVVGQPAAPRAVKVRQPGAPAQRALQPTVRVFVNGVAIIYRQIPEPEEAKDEIGEAEWDGLLHQPEAEAGSKTGALLIEGNDFDQILLGPGQNFESARQRLTSLLRRKIESFERVIGLSEAQKQKLQLAGNGDIARFFETVSKDKQKFERLAGEIKSMNELLRWHSQVTAESKRLCLAFEGDPFDRTSLFYKTFMKIADSEQLAEFEWWRNDAAERAKRDADPTDRVPVAKAVLLDRDESLDDPRQLAAVLRTWGQATAKIDRLDCTFTWYTYDTTFETERRATGSLAVDRQGRAAYRLIPAVIRRAAVSGKCGTNGAPYELRPNPPARWHWTGASIVHVNEAEGTFDAIPLPAEHQIAGEIRPARDREPRTSRPSRLSARALKNTAPAARWHERFVERTAESFVKRRRPAGRLAIPTLPDGR
jgi:hypothetical protein